MFKHGKGWFQLSFGPLMFWRSGSKDKGLEASGVLWGKKVIINKVAGKQRKTVWRFGRREW